MNLAFWVAEAAGETLFRTILLWHSQGRRKGDTQNINVGDRSFIKLGYFGNLGGGGGYRLPRMLHFSAGGKNIGKTMKKQWKHRKTQNHPTMIPKRFKNGPKMIPKYSQNRRKNDPKMTPT